MSTQRGNASRTRAQKYKNRHRFKNDLHDKTPQQTMLNAMHISDVCQHCKGVLEWKIKYKKYKPLSQPKVCTRCQERNIRNAYHVLCRNCARAAGVCAKCLKSAEEVEIEAAPPSEMEQIKMRAEMNRLMKSLPERKRRAFVRYMEKGKIDQEDLQKENASSNEDEEDGPKKEAPSGVPYTREELLEKFEQLKSSVKNPNDFDLDELDLDSGDDDSECTTSDEE